MRLVSIEAKAYQKSATVPPEGCVFGGDLVNDIEKSCHRGSERLRMLTTLRGLLLLPCIELTALLLAAVHSRRLATARNVLTRPWRTNRRGVGYRLNDVFDLNI
jgi:hypothetical protein